MGCLPLQLNEGEGLVGRVSEYLKSQPEVYDGAQKLEDKKRSWKENCIQWQWVGIGLWVVTSST